MMTYGIPIHGSESILLFFAVQHGSRTVHIFPALVRHSFMRWGCPLHLLTTDQHVFVDGLWLWWFSRYITARWGWFGFRPEIGRNQKQRDEKEKESKQSFH